MSVLELLGFIPLGCFIAVAALLTWRSARMDAKNSDQHEDSAKKPARTAREHRPFKVRRKKLEPLVVDSPNMASGAKPAPLPSYTLVVDFHQDSRQVTH